jgi:hypothetical protein
MTLNSNVYTKGTDIIRLDMSPRRVSGSVLLPVKALGKALGVSVTWSTEETKLIGAAKAW